MNMTEIRVPDLRGDDDAMRRELRAFMRQVVDRLTFLWTHIEKMTDKGEETVNELKTEIAALSETLSDYMEILESEETE